jgi:tetratricopeptide (TPR) repeat protein
MQLACYQALRRPNEALALVKARLEETPEDSELMATEASINMHSGDFKKARAQYEALVAGGKAEGVQFNNLAWLGLFDSNLPLKKAIEYAERATQSSKSYGTLHTRAALEAEAGNGPAAMALLLEGQRMENREKLSPASWYVLARVAEGYGLVDVARAAYQKSVEGTADEGPASTGRLARRAQDRLKKSGQAVAIPSL